MNIIISVHLFNFGYISHLSSTEFTESKKIKKNQYLPLTSMSDKLLWGTLHDSILLEFELTDL